MKSVIMQLKLLESCQMANCTLSGPPVQPTSALKIK